MIKTLIFLPLIALHFSLFSQTSSVQKITEKDSQKQNYFGSSGDIDGDYAVVCGVHSDNPNAWHGGKASLYKKGTDGKWKLTREMYPESGSIEDRFGQGACAISNDYVIVGDWMNTGQKYGAAHLFKFWGNTEWEHQITLKPSNINGIESFGQSVDIHNRTAVVGATNAAFIFERQADDSWKEMKKLTPPQPAEGYGQEVAIYGDFLLVNAQWEDVNGIKNSGAVYVYHRDEKNSWSLFEKIFLDADTMEEEDEFGEALTIYENQILIGCPRGDMGEISGAGKVFLYQINQTNIVLKQTLFAKDFGRNKYGFGERVAIGDDFIAIAEAQSREHKGSVYVFENKGDEFVEVDRFISPIESYYGNDFGQSGLAISGNNVFVGAPGDGHCGEELDACGSAYFYGLKKSKTTVSDTEDIAYIPRGITEDQMNARMQKHNADSIVFDPINEDGVYILRNAEIGLWGMYQFEKEIIPMAYDHIEFYNWNSPITFVQKEGKWGIFYGSFSDSPQETVPCLYDELKRFNYQGYLYIAGKKEGKWSWVNWFNGIENGGSKSFHQELTIDREWNPGNYSYFNID